MLALQQLLQELPLPWIGIFLLNPFFVHMNNYVFETTTAMSNGCGSGSGKFVHATRTYYSCTYTGQLGTFLFHPAGISLPSFADHWL